jgi:transposase
VQAFEHFGGVPGRIRYDNLKQAVARVMKGCDRVESERFTAMRSHYMFDSFFCFPGKDGAHEKGGVEGESAGSVADTWSPCPGSSRWPNSTT